MSARKEDSLAQLSSSRSPVRRKRINRLSLHQGRRRGCFLSGRSEKALSGLGQAGAQGCAALSAGQISLMSDGSLEALHGKGERQTEESAGERRLERPPCSVLVQG